MDSDDQQKKAAVYRLGNMTLLEAAANRGAETIRSRQSWLAKQAAAVWRIDF